MKRGHSNVTFGDKDYYRHKSGCLMIRLVGGASFDKCKELPPLAIHRDDWEKIGKIMGWYLSIKQLEHMT